MAKTGKLHHMLDHVRTFMIDYAYLVTLGAVIAIIAASAVYTRHLHSETGVQAAAEAPEVQASSSPSPEPLPTPEPHRPYALWPLKSQAILRGYDAESSILWNTMGCFQPHPALDIAGEAEETVRCIHSGVVLLAVRDDLWGWRIQIEQEDGRLCEYAGLASVFVSAGQTVTRGQPLGTLLSALPCEAELGPHLHLTLWEDGQTINPEPLLSTQKIF